MHQIRALDGSHEDRIQSDAGDAVFQVGQALIKEAHCRRLGSVELALTVSGGIDDSSAFPISTYQGNDPQVAPLVLVLPDSILRPLPTNHR